MSSAYARLVLPFACKSDDAAPGLIEGYAATFGDIDLGRDRIVKGAFTKTLASFAASSQMPALLWGHDRDEPIGEWLELREDDKGLFAKGRLWVGTGIPKAEQAWRLARSSAAKGFSIGYIAERAAIDHTSGLRDLQEITLKEISLTPFPMNPAAVVTDAKGFAGIVHQVAGLNSLTQSLRAMTPSPRSR